ncbi:MAG: tRNA pseudouridine(55) synthase TruB [Minisyncoccia bacterium]
MEGIGAFWKPKNITSFSSLKIIKSFLKEEKIGHGGTLDPFAEGILVFAIRKKYTKKLEKILKDSEKEYLAKIILGSVSTTDDLKGEIIKIKVKKIPQKEEILNTLKFFEGEILQIPPKFSAIKIKGKRSYILARKGEDFKLKPRKVFIKKIELINYSFPELEIKIICGSGVYIRSLAKDIGEKLWVGAYLKELIRERINDFQKEVALEIEDLKNNFLELEILISGRVQRVGFRAFSKILAFRYKIFGFSENLSDGKVRILAQGGIENLNNFLEEIKKGTPLSKIEDTFVKILKPKIIFNEFKIKL